MGQSLYDITGSYKEVMEMMDSDVDVTAIRDTLEGIEAEFSDKAVNVVHVTLNLDGDINAIKTEIDRLTERKRVLENRQKSLKDYLRDNMVAAEIKKISCELFTITCVYGRQIAVIDDEALIPDDFIKVETKLTPKKNEIVKAIKDGADVPGAHLERGQASIRIK